MDAKKRMTEVNKEFQFQKDIMILEKKKWEKNDVIMK